jgi:carbonic anhydrase
MQALFRQLEHGQKPSMLFITCSDSRVVPNLITQTDPGELFVMRTAGNIVPRYSSSPTAEGATIEYAVCALGVQDIVVCGHYRCGAMQGLLAPEQLESLPTVAGWLKKADAARRAVEKHAPDATGDERVDRLVEQNVLLQLEHLRSHPSVADAEEKGKLALHGWSYRFETGDVVGYSADDKKFISLEDE